MLNKRNHHISRKEQRKNDRIAKKQRKSEHYTRIRSKELSKETDIPASGVGKKLPDIEIKADRSKIRPTESSVEKDGKIKKKHSGTKKANSSEPSIDDDDVEIERMAKKLKIQKDKKLPKEFKEDGLDYILNGIETGFASDQDAFSDPSGSDAAVEDWGGHESDSVSEADESFEEKLSDESESADENADDRSDVESDSAPEYEEHDSGSEAEQCNSFGSEDSINKPSSCKDFGHPNKHSISLYEKENQEAQPSQEDATYKPPGKRTFPASESAALIKKSVQGALNRLSESNVEPILNQIHIQINSHPRKDVCDALSESLCSFLGENTATLESFIYSSACLSSLQFSMYGTDFSGHLIEAVWEAFTGYLSKSFDQEEQNEKTCLNFVSFFCYLYLFENISSHFIFSLLDYLLTNDALALETRLQFLLKSLKICSFKLRSDDSDRFKAVLSGIDANGATDSKVRFMIDVLNDYKLNKKNVIKPYDSTSSISILKKVSQALLKKYCAIQCQPLQITVNDLTNSQSKGKWWIIGGVWKQSDSGIQKQPINQEGNSDDTLVQKASAIQHMNTLVRKAIFEALMRATDQSDAVYRINAIGLKGAQEREIARVLVYCLGKEKHYNPFYATVAQQLCACSYNHCITFRFVLWDFFNDILTKKSTKTNTILNYSKFYAQLISEGVLSLVVLKGISLDDLQAGKILFLQSLLTAVGSNGGTAQGERVTGIESVLERLVFIMDHYVLNAKENPFYSAGSRPQLKQFRQLLIDSAQAK